MEFMLQSTPSKESLNIEEHSCLKHVNSIRKITKVHILNTSEENVDDMFYQMRNYFDQGGYLLQKELMETINIKESTILSINRSQIVDDCDDEECNVSDSEITTEQVYNIPAFNFKNQVNPKSQREIEEIIDTKTKIKYGFDWNQGYFEINNKVGPQSFNVIKLLGVGSFGEVFLVEKKDNHKLYAMKVLKKERVLSRNLRKYAIAERNVLCVTSHPFIVKLHYAFQTEDRLFLIIEYCSGGDLVNYLETEDWFNEDKARFYISEIVLAIEDLHKRGIIYRDLKPGNILLDKDGHVRLTDFGLSKEDMQKSDYFTRSFWGSYAYLAPEMVNKVGHTMSIDWYLLGVVLYELLQGVPPYYDWDKDTLMKNIKDKSLEIPTHHSKNAQDLMK